MQKDTHWPNHRYLKDTLNGDRLTNTDRWGCVNTNIESQAWTSVCLRSELSDRSGNLISCSSARPLTWLTCIPPNTPHHNVISQCTVCTGRSTNLPPTMSRHKTHTVAMCVYTVWWALRLHCRSGLGVVSVWRRVSGVRWGHPPPHAAEAVCH